MSVLIQDEIPSYSFLSQSFCGKTKKLLLNQWSWSFFQSPRGSLCVLSLSAEFSLENRTCVALAGRSVIHQLKVTIPANSTGSTIRCYQNSQKVWEQLIHRSSTPKTIPLTANITMHNSSSSGEYYFQYMDKKLYWVVLVRGE